MYGFEVGLPQLRAIMMNLSHFFREVVKVDNRKESRKGKQKEKMET